MAIYENHSTGEVEAFRGRRSGGSSFVSYDRWLAAWSALGAITSDGMHELYTWVTSCYAEPHRHYHTNLHLVECFRVFDKIASTAIRPAEVEVAIWFHDVIYDSTRTDNELQSAEAAREIAERIKVPAAAIDRIYRLILSTRHAVEPAGPDEEVLADVDLSILGAERTRVGEYDQQIRQEYAWIDLETYRAGRRAVLEGFLNRPRIYRTEICYRELEDRARANLERLIAHLVGNT